MSPNHTARGALLIAVSAAGVALGSTALATPVTIGRHTVIPYGVSASHPSAMEGIDAGRSNRSRQRLPPTAPASWWQARVQVRRNAPPAIGADGSLYLSTHSGVVALDANGLVRWEVALGAAQGAPAILPSGDIVVGTGTSEIVVLTRRGEVLARQGIGGGLLGSPLVLDDGTIVAAVSDQSLRFLDQELRMRARMELPGLLRGAPTFSRTRVYAGFELGLAVADIDGTPLGTTMFGAAPLGPPSVSPTGELWMALHSGDVIGVDGNGAVRTRIVADPNAGAMAVVVGNDGLVRVARQDNVIVALGAERVERWRVTLDDAIAGPMVVDARDTTVALTRRGTIYAIERDGAVRWTLERGMPAAVASVAIGARGVVYVTSSMTGMVQAYR